MKKGIIIGAIIVLLLVILGVASKFLVWTAPYYEREGAQTEEIIISELPMGTIEGSLSYPSEEIPPLVTCAEKLDTVEEFCTYEMIHGSAYTYSYGYKLEVPPGEYMVYSKIAEDAMVDAGDLYDYKAYYTEFVTCGLEFDCPSHFPITVEVRDGETIKNIDTTDWYDF